MAQGIEPIQNSSPTFESFFFKTVECKVPFLFNVYAYNNSIIIG